MAGQSSMPPTRTSLDSSSNSNISHLIRCLHELGATTLAEKVTRCCTHFRVLACDKGHVYRPIPAERCRLRLCRNCARWRQHRAVTRLRPAIEALRRRYPEDRWILITLTAKASRKPLGTQVNRMKGWFRKFRRTATWKTASRQAWVTQADLATAWQGVTRGQGTVVDIRNCEGDMRTGLGRTLTYAFKPINLGAWGPAQIAEFMALGRAKLAECYGALRGLATEPAEDGEETDESGCHQSRGRVLTAGAPCPSCGAPLVAQWYTGEEKHWAQRLAAHRPQAPPDCSQAA